jgi:hypothetical protein
MIIITGTGIETCHTQPSSLLNLLVISATCSCFVILSSSYYKAATTADSWRLPAHPVYYAYDRQKYITNNKKPLICPQSFTRHFQD